MNLKALLFSITIALFVTQFSYGQSQAVVDRTKEELKGSMEGQQPSIEQQFQYILDKSYNYATDDIPFEVIKNRYLLAFKDHLNDTLSQLQHQIDQNDTVVAGLNQQIEQSNSKIQELETKNTELSTQTSSINVLGLAIEKSLFKIIVLILVLILIITIVFISSKLKSANAIVEEAKSDAENAHKEQERFRRTSMEREQKLKREILNLSKKSTTTLTANPSAATPKKKTEDTKKASETKKSPKK